MPRRAFNQLRPLSIIPHYLGHPEGSCLICCGETRVICTATVEESVPKWLNNKGKGWVTAEYDMLPRATSTRNQRDSHKGKINGRSQEISRLIGRALRAVVDTSALGERTVTVDCDVIQADGGTRTTSITGGYVALAIAIGRLVAKEKVRPGVLKDNLAAISVGLIEGCPFLDLDYGMDSRAQVDMNVVLTGKGELVEVQGTGEGSTFKRAQLDALLDLAMAALPALSDLQKRAIAQPFTETPSPVCL
jgi:ribonuclease PH